MDVVKISEGSPLLAGPGLVALPIAADAVGLSVEQLLTELQNIRAEVLVNAIDWIGVEILIDKVEKDFDGSFLLNGALEEGVSTSFSGLLLPSKSSYAIQQLVQTGKYSDGLFYKDRKRRKALFIDDPGRTVGIEGIQIQKQAVEIVRLRMAKHIAPSALGSAKGASLSAISTVLPVTPDSVANPKFASMRISELVERFSEYKQSDWGLERRARMATSYALFVELMGDPTLAEVNRDLMRTYVERLKAVPKQAGRVRNRYGVQTYSDLIDKAAEAGLPLLSELTVTDHGQRMSELFGWAVKEDYFTRNLAMSLAKPPKKKGKDQDKRDVFTEDELAKIFGADWFANGGGATSSNGKFHDFRPHYYWLPLIGLFTGARLNEVCQLYLSDIRQTASGVHYFDFNLDGADKVRDDADSDVVSDKSLKTVNAERVVPVHQKLIDLGFMEYVEALRKEGCIRLFPELSRDALKGYGKDPGKWFNSRYLDHKLKIPRNGKKTFHSFRHMVDSSLYAAGVDKLLVHQLLGHERGSSISENRYRKDLAPDKLVGVINKLEFKLPPISKYNVPHGMKAVRWILKEKARRALVLARSSLVTL